MHDCTYSMACRPPRYSSTYSATNKACARNLANLACSASSAASSLRASCVQTGVLPARTAHARPSQHADNLQVRRVCCRNLDLLGREARPLWALVARRPRALSRMAQASGPGGGRGEFVGACAQPMMDGRPCRSRAARKVQKLVGRLA
ncbi:hypothetical protein PYCCODRAFT_1133361 [Trametes coccinea BRFM310]|uniref:Uncharacterized protein n=1 Tax=Trametes coccinea (strain BRFM310) TaxID=1353009 RepID=A0A1Y2I8S6_TRAC3|nr:hypothetical protein PYCCODRAFT_1133361 [Trametes coccinea BRFM310]